MVEKSKVFVYGTLRTGFGNNGYFLKNSTLLGRCTIKGGVALVDLGAFPALVLIDAAKAAELRAGVVRGEVWEVDAATLSELDRLEGVPTFYYRTHIQTQYGQAATYAMNSDILANELPIVDNGLWHGQPDEEAFFRSNLVYTRVGKGVGK